MKINECQHFMQNWLQTQLQSKNNDPLNQQEIQSILKHFILLSGANNQMLQTYETCVDKVKFQAITMKELSQLNAPALKTCVGIKDPNIAANVEALLKTLNFNS